MLTPLLALALSSEAAASDAAADDAMADDSAAGDSAKGDRSWALFGVPLVSYDSNLLLGLGGYGQFILKDPTERGPYKLNVGLQIYGTTGGYQKHFLRVDVPFVAGSPWRIRLEGQVLRWTRAPYLGIGNATPRLEEGSVSEQWYLYHQTRDLGRVDLRRLMWGEWELFGSYSFRREGVEVFDDSLLAEQSPQGIEGGIYAWAALGVLIDTRTNEIDPHEGLAWDLSARVAAPWTGSDWSVWGLNSTFRIWLPLHERLVSASQLVLDARFGEEPFFNQAYYGGLGRAVIGGRWSLRGLPEERYRGDGLALLQQELRATVWTPQIRDFEMAWMVVPFVDVARIWAWDEPDPDPLHVHLTGGAGLRVDLQHLIVLRADAGVGIEEYAEGDPRRPMVQVYVLSEHPF